MSNLLEQASLVLIPSGYKEDVVYSEIPLDGSGDMAFSRASNGTRTNSAGLVEVCPWNFVQNSETFTSSWTTSNVTITANDTTAPNGTSTAEKALCASGSSISPNIYYSGGLGCENGQVYTYSYYAKKGSSNFAKIRFSGTAFASVTNTPIFNLNTGVVVSGTGTIQDVGNGWYRISATATAEANASGVVTIDIPSSTGVWPNGNFAGTEYIYIWGAQLNIGSTAKPYFPTTDRLNVPRLTYQNGGGGCPSLLLEKQSTNLALYSNALSTNPNIVDSDTTTANVYISPDGTQNAMQFTETTANDRHGFYQYTTVSAQTYTASIFTKQTGRRYIACTSNMTGTVATSYFDLQTISVVSSGSGYTCTIQDFGNGWLRLILTFTASAGNRFIIWGGSPDGTSYQYAGNTSISQTFYGYQLEASSYATSYIPTTSSSATRVADFATTNNISSLFGSTEGSFFIEMTADFTNTNGAIPLFLRSSINSTFNRATYLQFGSGTITLNVYLAGALEAAIFSGSYTQGQKLKIAFAYKQNDFVLYINGSLIGTDTSGNISASLAFIDLGTYSLAASTFQYNGAISEAVLFPTRLTNTQLAQLTA